MKKALIFALALSACGDIASTDSTTSNSQDNSIDNSQHGVTSCSRGSSVVCDFEGNEWKVDEVCTGPSGDPIFLNGPDFFPEQPAQCEFENSVEADVDNDGDTETVGTVDSGFNFND